MFSDYAAKPVYDLAPLKTEQLADMVINHPDLNTRMRALNAVRLRDFEHGIDEGVALATQVSAKQVAA
jgi:hypothetical protein